MGIQYEFYAKDLINVSNRLSYRPSHFLPIKAGSWSDDGDNLLLLLRTINESKTQTLDYMAYAKKKKHWALNGISELGQTTGVGCAIIA